VTRRRVVASSAWLLIPLGAAVAWVAGSAFGPHLGHSTKLFPLAVAGLAGVVALTVAVTTIEPAWILSIGMALAVFSGNWTYLHIPGPIDRVVTAAGIAAVLIRSQLDPSFPRLNVRRVHWLLALLALYAIGSAAWVQTLSTHAALFELLDRLGLFPFLLYLVGPSAFATERQRNTLLVVLVVVGAYLGLTAVFEVIGPHSLVFPSYIKDPTLGIHEGRARGPFLEAGADGLVMFYSAIAGAMLLPKVTDRRVRWAIVAAIALCGLGIVLSLTRQVWLGSVAGAVIAASLSPRLRRLVPIGLAIAAVGVGGALVAIPGLQGKLSGRASSQKPVWDRLNSDAAALRMIESRPVLGFGWGRFPAASPTYYHVAGSYPLSGVTEVHNVILSNAAELGLIGVGLWLVCLAIAVLVPFRRRGPPELDSWRLAMVAITVAWFVQLNFTPLSYALANYLPWLFAGIAFGLSRADRNSAPPAPHPTSMDGAGLGRA